MSTDLKAAARTMLDRPWNHGDLDALDEVLAPEYVAQTPFGEVRGPEGVKAIITEFRATFPDVSMTIDGQWAEGDTVVSRWTAKGTQQGPLRGIEPTGKQVTFSGVLILRFEGDRAVEAWQHFDRLTMLEQIGAVPTPAGAAAG